MLLTGRWLLLDGHRGGERVASRSLGDLYEASNNHHRGRSKRMCHRHTDAADDRERRRDRDPNPSFNVRARADHDPGANKQSGSSRVTNSDSFADANIDADADADRYASHRSGHARQRHCLVRWVSGRDASHARDPVRKR